MDALRPIEKGPSLQAMDTNNEGFSRSLDDRTHITNIPSTTALQVSFSSAAIPTCSLIKFCLRCCQSLDP